MCSSVYKTLVFTSFAPSHSQRQFQYPSRNMLTLVSLYIDAMIIIPRSENMQCTGDTDSTELNPPITIAAGWVIFGQVTP